MNTAIFDSFLFAFAITLFLELFHERIFPRLSRRRGPSTAPTIAFGIMLTIGAMLAMGVQRYGYTTGPGVVSMIVFLVGCSVVLAAGIYSDFTLASSRRHLYATFGAGVLLVLGKITFPILTIPFVGSFELNWFSSLFLTVIWVLLIVSIMELCSLLPVVAYTIVMLMAIPHFIGFEVFNNFCGAVLSGALVGCIPGRIIGGMMGGTQHPLGKAEVLVLGLTAAAATLASFMKSFTIVTFVIPVGLVMVVIILMSANQFDRTLILRAGPREGKG